MAILLCKKELSNKRIWEVISLPNKKLLAFLESHPEGAIAVSHIEKPDSNQAVGVKSTLLQFCRIFRELQSIDGKFSLRQWIRQDDSEFLFLPVPPEFRELLAPAYGAAINTMIRELLSLPDDLERRRFFILDELGALQRLSALVDALTLGRSKGMGIFIGVQDFGRIDDLYGKSVRETLWNNSTTKMILRTDSPHCAEFLAKTLGQSEVEESSHGHSMGIKDGRDGLNLSRQVHTRYTLLPSEISAIPDLTAAVKVAGLDPAYPCKIIRREIEPTGAPAFLERDERNDWVGEEIDLKPEQDEQYPEGSNEPEDKPEDKNPERGEEMSHQEDDKEEMENFHVL
jgi:type IV secretory pathway TraG/TraD family ATPase VirD4